MSDDAKFYNQCIWNHMDKQISTCILSLDLFTVKDDYGTNIPRLKLSIRQPKSRYNKYVSLRYQDVFQFLSGMKSFETDAGNIQKEIVSNKNQEAIKNYTFNISSKTLIISLMYRAEYNGLCCRVIISDRPDNYLESEKVFMSVIDWASFLKLLVQYRDNYLTSITSFPLYIVMDELNTKVDILTQKLTQYHAESMEISQIQRTLVHNQNEIAMGASVEYNPFDTLSQPDSNKPSSSTSGADIPDNQSNEIAALHADMTKYLHENSDKFELDLPPDLITKPPVNDSQARVLDSDFTSIVLQDDIMNLEMYLTNLVNDDVPFLKWRNMLEKKLGFSIFGDAHDTNIRSCDYLVSSYVKTYMKLNIESKKEFPSVVTTVCVPSNSYTPSNLSLMYDMLVYFIYYGQLRNVLKEKDFNPYQNKEFVTFALKSLSAPFVFSSILSTTEDILCSEVVNRYRKYKENGVFKNLDAQIYERFSLNFNLDETVLKNELIRLYNAFKSNMSKFTVDTSFSRFPFVKLSYDDFKKNKFDDEQIKKLIYLEFDPSALKSNDGIPLDVLEKFGILDKKFDNTNLKRFVKEQCKNDEKLTALCLEVVSSINESYRDLIGKTYDLAFIPEIVLKAIYMWDISKDPKIQHNYLYFCENVSKSSITKPMVISLICSPSTPESVDFVGSFKSAMEE